MLRLGMSLKVLEGGSLHLVLERNARQAFQGATTKKDLLPITCCPSSVGREAQRNVSRVDSKVWAGACGHSTILQVLCSDAQPQESLRSNPVLWTGPGSRLGARASWQRTGTMWSAWRQCSSLLAAISQTFVSKLPSEALPGITEHSCLMLA